MLALRSLLARISLGQYPTKFYHKGKGTYSSSLGGIITILLGLVLLTVSLNLLLGCINRETWTKKTEVIRLQDWEHANITLGDVMKKGLIVPVVGISISNVAFILDKITSGNV